MTDVPDSMQPAVAEAISGLASVPAAEPATQPVICVVEDDPAVAALASDLCRALGASAALFSSTTPFLRAFSHDAPGAVVLDWRLEREVGAAAFMAIRHRFPSLPVVCWTASPPDGLPDMIHRDPMTRVVDKAAGTGPFETAVQWALRAGSPGAEVPATGGQPEAQPAS